MNVPEVTYEDYKDYGGSLGEDDFKSSLRHAEACVRSIIGFNEPVYGYQKKAYVNAVCAAIEVETQYGGSHGIGEGLASVSIGSFSASAGTSSDGQTSAYDEDMAKAIKRELAGTGLLYQGIG